MQFHSDTQAILTQVEAISGKPVEFVPDKDLPVLSRITRARGAVPAHVVRYKPGSPGLDYVIAYQAAFTLRFYQTPPAERYDFAGRDEGRASVRKMLTEPGGVVQKMGLPTSVADPLAAQFFDGLMTQLRSSPPGMRIDQWIADTYPALRSAQRASIDRQQGDNLQVLDPQTRAIAPPAIYNPNVAMNAAYARFADRLLENPAYSVPYRSNGFLERGERLLTILEQMPRDAAHDRALVDAWADELGVRDWVAWIPAQD